MGVTHEGHEVVLTQGGEGDIADHHHFVVTGLKRGAQMGTGVGLNTFEELDIHVGDSARSFEQTVAIDIFANRDEQLADGCLDSVTIDHEPSPL